jgi:hypothetical protein
MPKLEGGKEKEVPDALKRAEVWEIWHKSKKERIFVIEQLDLLGSIERILSAASREMKLVANEQQILVSIADRLVVLGCEQPHIDKLLGAFLAKANESDPSHDLNIA